MARPRLSPEARPLGRSKWSGMKGALAHPKRASNPSAFLIATWAWLASILVVLVRWLEIAFMWVGAKQFPETVGTALLGGALLPGMTVGIGIVVWAALRAGNHPGVAMVGSLLVAFGFGAVVSLLRPYSFVDAWNIETASAFASDLLVILSAALCALVASTLTKGYLRVLVAGVCAIAGVGLLIVLTVAFAFVAGLRNPINPDVLWHTLMTLGELSTIVAGEADGWVWAVLLACFTLFVTAIVMLSVRAAKRQRLQEEPAGIASALWTMLPVLLVLGLLPPPPAMLEYGVLARVDIALRAPEMDIDESMAAAHRFNAREARLVASRTAEAKNVIVVVLESHRRRSTTPYVPSLGTTPYLDALAQQGLLVEDMYAVVPHTNKSLVSIFAGVYPRLTPDYAANQPGGLPARGLPALLEEHGFSTAFFTPATMEYEDKGVILDNLGFGERFGDGDFSTAMSESKNYFGHQDHTILDSTHAWIDAQTKDGKPFFLGLLTLSAHHPYTIPESFPNEVYSSDDELNGYLNSLRYTDSFLRDFWEGIKARGLAESTLLIVVGDHGEAFGEHGAVTHSDVIWDEALEVPAVVVGPGVEPGRARGSRSLVDILPTVADALGFSVQGARGLPGLSLLHSVPEDRAVYHAPRSYSAALSLRRGGRKFIAWSQRPPQVFDTAADPGEKYDLAEDDTSPDMREEIRQSWAEVLAWKDGVSASYGRSD